MTAPASAATPALALGDVDAELANTRRVLERLPDDRLAWRPHAKSWTLGELATHVTRLPGWGREVAERDAFDLATLPRATGDALPSRDAIVEAFATNAAAFRAAVAALADAALGAPWTLRRGEQVVMSMPRLVALRTMTLNHLVHHRAQLTVYLRLLDVPVPGLYGQSADEK